MVLKVLRSFITNSCASWRLMVALSWNGSENHCTSFYLISSLLWTSRSTFKSAPAENTPTTELLMSSTRVLFSCLIVSKHCSISAMSCLPKAFLASGRCRWSTLTPSKSPSSTSTDTATVYKAPSRHRHLMIGVISGCFFTLTLQR